MIRRICLMVSMVAGLAGNAWAQAYPDRTITLVCPYSPGGTSDTLARIFAAEMTKELGQTVVIENRAGGAGIVGPQLVTEAEADGYTLLVGDLGPLVLAPLVNSGLAYDPASFVPVYNFANVSNALVVHGKSGLTSVDELVAFAKKNPGVVNFSSAGTGTLSHFSGAMFTSLAGISEEVVHIPYDGGSQAAVAAASGEVHYSVGPLAGNMMGVITGGQVTPLAVSGDKRVPALPDVPTFAEVGLPDFQVVSWYGIVAPAGTPPEAIEKLNAAANKAAGSPEVVDALAKQGISPITNSPAEFAEQVERDIAVYGKLVQDGVVTFDRAP